MLRAKLLECNISVKDAYVKTTEVEARMANYVFWMYYVATSTTYHDRQNSWWTAHR